MRLGHGGRGVAFGRRGGHDGASLFGQLLQVLVALLPHVDPLGDVTHGRVLCIQNDNIGLTSFSWFFCSSSLFQSGTSAQHSHRHSHARVDNQFPMMQGPHWKECLPKERPDRPDFEANNNNKKECFAVHVSFR